MREYIGLRETGWDCPNLNCGKDWCLEGKSQADVDVIVVPDNMVLTMPQAIEFIPITINIDYDVKVKPSSFESIMKDLTYRIVQSMAIPIENIQPGTFISSFIEQVAIMEADRLAIMQQEMYDSNPSTAQGEALDRLAAKYGIVRCSGCLGTNHELFGVIGAVEEETDVSLRERVINEIKVRDGN